MTWRQSDICKLRVETIIETPTFKLLDIYFLNEFINFHFNAIYKFYKITTESLTYFC
jgi:hypothetical protein